MSLAHASRFRRASADSAWAACAILLPAIAALMARLRMTDLAYHIRIGDEILRTGVIPRVDTYTFTIAGTPWIDQQWAAQVLFAGIFRTGGWEAITVLRMLLTVATFGFVYLACRARGASVRGSALLTIAAFIVALVALPMRPQLLALPLLSATVWLLASRDKRPLIIWGVPLIAFSLANVHGSFLLVPVLAALAWLDDMLAKAPTARRTLIVTVSSLGATLVNPFGLMAWSYALTLSTNPVIRGSITEWRPMNVSEYPGVVVFASMIAIVILLARRGERASVASLMTLGLLAFMALSAQRSLALWAVIAPPVVAAYVPRKADAHRGPAIPALALTSALLVMVVVLLPWWRPDRPASLFQDVPVELTAEVDGRLSAGTRTLVFQPWASWFLFAVPDLPLFLDSRIELVPQDVWDDYDAVAFAGADWQGALDRWDVEAIVARKGSWPITPWLRRDPAWRVAYEDDDGILFVRP